MMMREFNQQDSIFYPLQGSQLSIVDSQSSGVALCTSRAETQSSRVTDEKASQAPHLDIPSIQTVVECNAN